MTGSAWFDDLPVVGKLSPARAAAKLREAGEDEVAAALERRAGDDEGAARGLLDDLLPLVDKPWQHTAHSFGFLPPAPPGSGLLPLYHAGNIPPAPWLQRTGVTITLERLQVAAYPGGGTHRILFDFYAQNQVPNAVEHLHFNATYRVREGEQAAILGYPIFVGLNVGPGGLAFRCYTVNVQNDADETFLALLESDVFRAGLRLASAVQPALAPLSGMAYGLTKTVATRHRNVPVQDFYLGLDFGAVPTGARLAEGAYFVVQIPETMRVAWNWNEWAYHADVGQVVNRADPRQLIPYNYVAFGVSRHHGG